MKIPSGEVRTWLGQFSELCISQSSDKTIRDAGSSGGVISSLLAFALKNREISAAIVVRNTRETGFHPDVFLARSEDEVLSAAGSKYVYIPFGELKKALDSAEADGEDVAVVAQPCHIETLRKMMDKGYYSNVVYLIGFFCGYNNSWEATEYLVRKTRLPPGQIAEIDYRGGPYPGGFVATSNSGKNVMFKKHHYDFINLMFVPKQCLGCKRYMAEDADVAVGDAWLGNLKKHSTVILRTKKGDALFNRAVSANVVSKKEILEEKLIAMHRHNLEHKKKGDSLFMMLVTKALNNHVAHKLVPFAFFGFLAKLRRKFKRKVRY